MPANRSLSGPSAEKSRRTRSGAESACGAACSAPPSGRLARPRVAPARTLSRMMRAARVAPARPARAPRVVALPGHLERRAHLGDRTGPLVGLDERELSPLRLRACSCLLAKRALAFKSISSSLLIRSFPRLGRRRPPAIWKGSASAPGAAAEALLAQSARLDGSTPASRATSAQAVPLSLHGCAARRSNSAVCFGHGFPMIRLRSPATAMVPKRDSTCQRIRGRFRFIVEGSSFFSTARDAGDKCRLR